MAYYLLALTGIVVATVIYGAQGRMRAPVAIFCLSAFMFGLAGLTDQASAARSEDTTSCVLGAAGVGLAWVGVGATAVTAEAHAGLLTALASGHASIATATWAHACPGLASTLLGGHPWVWHHSGCYRLSLARMHGLPLTICWHNVQSFQAWRIYMHARTSAIAAGLYTGRL